MNPLWWNPPPPPKWNPPNGLGPLPKKALNICGSNSAAKKKESSRNVWGFSDGTILIIKTAILNNQQNGFIDCFSVVSYHITCLEKSMDNMNHISFSLFLPWSNRFGFWLVHEWKRRGKSVKTFKTNKTWCTNNIQN